MLEENIKDEMTQWVTFKLQGEIYGVNVMDVQEVLRVTDIAPVPGAPDYVLGIINLRGNVVSVLDTRKRFGLAPKEPDDSTRIIILESVEQTVGILVDSVAEVEDVMPEDYDQAPNLGNDETAKYIDGVVSRKDYLLILVNISKLLSTEEWRELSAV